MRIRKRPNPFSPAPDVVSSTTTSLSSNHTLEAGSESCSSTGTSCGSCCLFSDEKKRKGETEKNRCSRQNGTGWRCANQSENGHSLCYHHLNLSRQWKGHQHVSKRHHDGDGDDDGSSNFEKFEVPAGKKKPRMMLLTSLLDRTLPNPTP